MLTHALDFTRAGLGLLDKTFILYSKIFDLVLAKLELNGHFVALLFSCFELGDQDVLVHLDLFFSLFHTHFELIFTVFKPVDTIGLNIDSVSELFDLQLHAIVLDKSLFLVFEDLVEVTIGHFVLKLKFLNLACQGAPLVFDLINGSLNVAALIFELLVRDSQLREGFLLLVKGLLDFEDLLLQCLSLFLRTLSTGSGDLSLHLLDLELSIVEELLLSLLLLLELNNVGLEVATG